VLSFITDVKVLRLDYLIIQRFQQCLQHRLASQQWAAEGTEKSECSQVIICDSTWDGVEIHTGEWSRSMAMSGGKKEQSNWPLVGESDSGVSKY
jgi:hypothetical protein